MKPPAPLLSDPSVLGAVRKDLEHFASVQPAYDVNAGAATLAKTLAALGPPTVSSPEQLGHAGSELGAASSVAKSASVFALKTTLVVVGGAVFGMAAFQALNLRPGAPTEQRTAPRSSQPEIPAPEHAPEAQPALVELEPETDVVDVVTAAQPEPARERRVQVHESPSRREIAQLMRIRKLLGRNPAAAYRLAEASQREFPDGALGHEREGFAIIALFELGEGASARTRALRFLARYPQGPLRERIERLAAE